MGDAEDPSLSGQRVFNPGSRYLLSVTQMTLGTPLISIDPLGSSPHLLGFKF